MRDNPTSEPGVPAWAQTLINILYIVCAVAGIVAGVYGLYVLVVHVLIVEEPNFVGLVAGVLLTGGGFGLFSLARNLLFRWDYKHDRYRPRRWALALLGLAGLAVVAYFAFVWL
jgi:hypothetical protein